MTLTLFLRVEGSDSNMCIGTVFSLNKDEDADILYFFKSTVMRYQFNTIVNAFAVIDEKNVKICDNESFVWACAMHQQKNRLTHLHLPIQILVRRYAYCQS